MGDRSAEVERANAGENPGGKLVELSHSLQARELARRALGKAVHRKALARLFEAWPDAQVEVRHDRTWRGIPFTGKRVQLRRTTVEVWEGEKNPIPCPQGHPINDRHVTREAVCHPDDTFRKADGVRIAFDRCLREAVRRAEPGRVMGLGRSR